MSGNKHYQIKDGKRVEVDDAELDKQLRNILVRGYWRTPEQCMEAIKQAFSDAGWKYDPIERVGYNPDAKGYSDRFPQVMTGQEWYDRFEASAPKQLTEADKLDFNLHDGDPVGNCYYAYNCAVDEVKKAAKKAAGIE